MGFYGNITNVSKTQFSFDKIYPSRRSMDLSCDGDGVFIGRFVLVEYEQSFDINTIHQAKSVEKINETEYYAYDTEEKNENTKLKMPIDTYIVVYAKDESHSLYICKSVEQDTGFSRFMKLDDNSSFYNDNYQVDKLYYPDAKRGYDSTVWQKVISETKEKYVMIAELNSVIPTFDLTVVQPTTNPIPPHFGSNSTDLYYDLHVQPQWGLRVAEAGENDLSDGGTTWFASDYHPSDNTIDIQETDIEKAAIYFNKAGFDPAKRTHIDNSNDEISILPTGSSGTIYKNHYEADLENIKDILEMRINLPTIGNMVSDGYDVIYGEDRQAFGNSEIRNDTSLKGILNNFSMIPDNTIPFKYTDGIFVGSTVVGDDWIVPIINNDYEVNDEITSVDAITFVHEYHPIENQTQTIDLNVENDSTLKIAEVIIDEKGHVVANKETTYTLPFGYKDFKLDEGMVSAVKASGTLNLKGDGWIKTRGVNGEMLFEHNPPSSKDLKSSISSIKFNANPKEQTFAIPNIYFDARGHISKIDTQTITLPGFGTINQTDSSVLTGCLINEENGQLVFQSKDLGNIKLGANVEGTDITETSTLISAFQSLYNIISTGESNIEGIINQIKQEIAGQIIESAKRNNVETDAGSGQFYYKVTIGDGSPLTEGITTIRFKASAGYSTDWPLMINGRIYETKYIDGNDAADGAWAQDSIVMLNLDNEGDAPIAYLCGGGSSGGITTIVPTFA